MAAEALAAEAVASRLARQEEDIRWLWAEVHRLRDEQLNAPDRCQAEGPCLTREVAQLRAENRELRHRLYRLRLCLAEELSHQARLESAARAEAGREAAGAQPPPSQSPEEDVKKEIDPDNEVKNPPNFMKERLKFFEILKKDHQLLLAISEKKGDTSNVITVRVADGRIVKGEAWKTTPYQVAAEISQELAETTVVAKVNGELWDLNRPLEGDATVELLTFEDEEAQAVYWHSSAHILGEALELHYGGLLCCSPPGGGGFHYDVYLEDRAVSSAELPVLQSMCQAIIKEQQPFERLEVSTEVLLDLFKYDKFKCRILKEKVATPTTTVYRCGPLVELCKGPHIRHTGNIKVIKIFKNSLAYWADNPEMEMLQRVYGVSFPDEQQMAAWEELQEEARARDHRTIGKEQHHQRNFKEVLSPNMYSCKLWEASGHWQHYSENMFTFDIDKDTFALKPMNCPGHWNEPSGALSGLTCVRRFQQDDAHIFCTVGQIEEEIKGCLQFLQSVYSTFGFSFQLNLSTRPENFLGKTELWDEAEKQLQNSLMEFGKPWKINAGDGAFYGPKIDVEIKDALGRYHQCATIQLDFQLPIRFNLTYVSKDGDDKKNPVIIHQAILGSVERMIAILSENYGGKWPFWLSPRQVMVIPVGPTCEKYALQISSDFFEEGFMADVDLDRGCTLNNKIRNAQLAQYNFIFVVGEKEETNNAVNVRTRDNKIHGEISVISTIDKLKNLKQSRTLNAEEEF
ncbi:hypothetical protein MJG53_012752 [Ovis ammon polii x Ovis aries]|uniref:Uncharacterized protein n=1 Tax=Ovis ammon polii x Ovis aries TaxID=2918886 RepID=A0ACB9ULZ8_9CETA|nr:hypothetical protein MJT46_012402 [Ovis ammon polii x Ovis aries]KAI4572914.1 hypothetical protein MJG53_012752 [Ovis ammon polii x Ovis aries]